MKTPNQARRILRASLPLNRDHTGTISLLDHNQTSIAGPFAVCARAGDQLAAEHGNPSRTTTLPFGDTPLGTYRVAGVAPTGPGTKYRRDLFGAHGVIRLQAKDGDAALADANGRFEILIHGGPLSSDGRLRATSGGMRVADADLRTLLGLLGDPATVICECVPGVASPNAGVVDEADLGSEPAPQSEAGSWVVPGTRRVLAPALVAQGEYTDDDQVDLNFIGQLEGQGATEGSVPDAAGSHSGVTVATGFDIGQCSAEDIDQMDIPADLKARLKDYAGLRGEEAQNYLDEHPLQITPAEAEAIDRVSFSQTISGVSDAYDDAAATSFEGLPAEAQTVIASVATQYGTNLASSAPRFWSAVTEGRWQDAVDELRDFGDRYQTRHDQEADRLQQALDRGALPRDASQH